MFSKILNDNIYTIIEYLNSRKHIPTNGPVCRKLLNDKFSDDIQINVGWDKPDDTLIIVTIPNYVNGLVLRKTFDIEDGKMFWQAIGIGVTPFREAERQNLENHLGPALEETFGDFKTKELIFKNEFMYYKNDDGIHIRLSWDPVPEKWIVSTMKTANADHISFNCIRTFSSLAFETIEMTCPDLLDILDVRFCYIFVMHHPEHTQVLQQDDPYLKLLNVISLDTFEQYLPCDDYDELFMLKVPNAESLLKYAVTFGNFDDLVVSYAEMQDFYGLTETRDDENSNSDNEIPDFGIDTVDDIVSVLSGAMDGEDHTCPGITFIWKSEDANSWTQDPTQIFHSCKLINRDHLYALTVRGNNPSFPYHYIVNNYGNIDEIVEFLSYYPNLRRHIEYAEKSISALFDRAIIDMNTEPDVKKRMQAAINNHDHDALYCLFLNDLQNWLDREELETNHENLERFFISMNGKIRARLCKVSDQIRPNRLVQERIRDDPEASDYIQRAIDFVRTFKKSRNNNNRDRDRDRKNSSDYYKNNHKKRNRNEKRSRSSNSHSQQVLYDSNGNQLEQAQIEMLERSGWAEWFSNDFMNGTDDYSKHNYHFVKSNSEPEPERFTAEEFFDE